MSSSSHFSYEILQLRPNQLLIYTYWPDVSRGRPAISEETGEVFEPNKKYTGLLSPYARKKLRYSINLLVAQSTWKTATNYELNKTFKFRINFITLTLSSPQGNISDKEIKRVCLNNFLNRAKKKWGLVTYVWRAEKQQNTNIHFHLTTDVFIHYKELCEVWNECQELLGFVSMYRERTGNYMPNSTDIHSVKDIKNLANYLVKYMSKKEKDAQLIEGKVWGCSKNLSQAKKVEIECGHAQVSLIKAIEKKYPASVFTNDHCTIISLPEGTFKKEIGSDLGEKYATYLASVKDPSLIPKLPTASGVSLPSNKLAIKRPVVCQLPIFS